MVHVFGGINLDFFGLGFMLRRAGTIFIRRSSAESATKVSPSSASEDANGAKSPPAKAVAPPRSIARRVGLHRPACPPVMSLNLVIDLFR